MKKGSPLVSTVMPVRNEESRIKMALRSIQEQTYPIESIEVIVADGQSEDNTCQKANCFKEKFFSFKLIKNPDRNTPAGINQAIAASKGEIFILVSGHCELSPNYIQICVKYLSEFGVDCVGGVLSNIANSSVGKAIAAAMSSPFGVGNAAFRTGSAKPKLVDTVAFGAYKRSIIERIGYFDESMTGSEDDEFNYRLRRNGGKILLVPEISAKYYPRSSISKLWKQYYEYGGGKAKMVWRHPHQMSWRQFVPPLFVVILLVFLILSMFNSIFKILLFGVIGVYLFTNFVASLLGSKKHGRRVFLYLPIIFFVLHISYGIGFLIGIIKTATH